MPRFQSFPSVQLGFSTALPGSALGACAAALSSTAPRRLRDFNTLAVAPQGLGSAVGSAAFGARVGLAAAWHLWWWLAANASGAILGATEGSMVLAPVVSFSVLAAMMVPAFWALLSFGAAGLFSGAVGGVVMATHGAMPAVMSVGQARLRSAVVMGALVTPGVVAASVACGLAPNVLQIFPQADPGRDQIDWRTKRSRFREM